MVTPNVEPKSFQLEIHGLGRINNADFNAVGHGQGNTGTGEFSFEVTISDVAKGTDPFAYVLGVLITPTGAFGREVGDAVGVLRLSGGMFGFTQDIHGEGIEVSSFGQISRTGEQTFTWNSRAEGHVKLKSLSAIDPFDVIMLPQGFGKIIEVIALPLIEEGKRKTVNSVRHFTFTPTSELLQLQFRHVTLIPKAEGHKVSAYTKSAIHVFPKTRVRP